MLNIGDYLALVLNFDGVPRVANVKVENDEPLTVLVPSSDWTGSLSPGTRVSLIWRGQSEGAHTDATITEITKYGLNLVIRLTGVAWSDFERRRAPRHRVDLSSEVTVVSEETGAPEFNKVTSGVMDLSLVGCRLVTDEEFEPGTLVAVNVTVPSGEGLRLLSVVTRTFTEPKGCALEFFDFLGNSRFQLHEYLKTLPEAA